VRTTKPKAAAAARIGAGLARQKRAELLGLLRSCFARTEAWLQAGKYVSAVAGGLAELNGWTIAEHAGDRTPDRTQRLLNRAAWNTFAAMGVVRRFAVAGLEQAARRSGRQGGLVIGAIDETGQEKAGEATTEVKRQYLGCAGKVANGINSPRLAWYAPPGPAFPPARAADAFSPTRVCGGQRRSARGQAPDHVRIPGHVADVVGDLPDGPGGVVGAGIEDLRAEAA
jgi:hypothetical protein